MDIITRLGEASIPKSLLDCGQIVMSVMNSEIDINVLGYCIAYNSGCRYIEALFKEVYIAKGGSSEYLASVIKPSGLMKYKQSLHTRSYKGMLAVSTLVQKESFAHSIQPESKRLKDIQLFIQWVRLTELVIRNA